MKRLDYDYVKNFIENEGYKLLDGNYINAHHKMNAICPVGHKIQITGNNGKKGIRCFECFGNKKYTIDEVKHSFNSENYNLLTKKYKNVNQNLHFICNKGHECKNINFKEGLNGKRCTKCNSRGHGYTIEEVREIFALEGYKLLTDSYKKTNQKLYFICSRGHNHSIIFNNGLRGHRCQKCQTEDYRCYDNYDDGKLYQKQVRSITMRNYRKYRKNINPNNLKLGRNFYHIDHKYSISEGFKNNIPIYIIGGVFNMEIISQNDNLEKGINSSISKETLFKSYFNNLENFKPIGYKLI